jgi:hypothetical protein
MIKVKVERAGESVFYVEDGVTVSYAEDVLEVLDEEDSVIAVFRGWVYALPITDEEYLVETGQVEPDDDDEDDEDEVDFVAPDPAAYVQVNSNGATYGLVDTDAPPTGL